MSTNRELIFQSTLEITSMDIDPECEEGDDAEILEDIEDRLRMGFEAIANGLRERYPDLEFTVTI